jgi:hypothetical protein
MRSFALAVAMAVAAGCSPAPHVEASSRMVGDGAAPTGASPSSSSSSSSSSSGAARATEAPSEVSADATEPPAGGFLQRFFAPADDYELDALDRSGPGRGKKPSCEHDAIVAYRGKTVRYEVPASVHRAFIPRLERFEEVVAEVGMEVYGRAPKVLHHAGGYMCRTSWRGRMSEHAFGNALDVGGFTFAPIGKSELAELKARGIELPAAQRRGFRIDVGETWRATSPSHAGAKRFFALLLERVRARQDVFRGMIGPPDPAHTTHLHLDAGPWTFSRYAPPT